MYAETLQVVRDLPNPAGHWELVEVIGEGNYGQVYKARAVDTGAVAAVKIMEAVVDKEEDIKSELNVFSHHSHHPNIVNFFGAFLKKEPLSDDQLWLVIEYCAAGSVTDLVKSMKEQGESLPESVIAYILREVLAGICYLHSSLIIHRDIKGQNVLLTSDARVKLIDFGISAIVNGPAGRRRTAIGTPYWMAPEVIACESQFDYDYDSRADVWSLGITAIEIADSTPPLFGENPMRALFKIPKNKAPTVQKPHMWTPQFNNFIAK